MVKLPSSEQPRLLQYKMMRVRRSEFAIIDLQKAPRSKWRVRLSNFRKIQRAWRGRLTFTIDRSTALHKALDLATCKGYTDDQSSFSKTKEALSSAATTVMIELPFEFDRFGDVERERLVSVCKSILNHDQGRNPRHPAWYRARDFKAELPQDVPVEDMHCAYKS